MTGHNILEDSSYGDSTFVKTEEELKETIKYILQENNGKIPKFGTIQYCSDYGEYFMDKYI